MTKHLYLLAAGFFLFLSRPVFAQAEFRVDSLYASVSQQRIEQVVDTMRPWMHDPQRTFHVEIFCDFSTIDSIILRLGSQLGQYDVLNMQMRHTMVNGSHYLTWRERSFVIMNGKAVIELNLPEVQISRRNYLWIRGKDTKGNQTQILSKTVN
ncbi:MAG: hypothetical protein ACJ75J_13175 [Cytophagaceae bacterium]